MSCAPRLRSSTTNNAAAAGSPPACHADGPPSGLVPADILTRMATSGAQDPSALITERIESLDDWRGAVLARVRALIHEAVPDVEETWKWRGVPVWEQHG